MNIDEIRARNVPRATGETLFPNGIPEGVDLKALEEYVSHYTTEPECPGCNDGGAKWSLAHGATHCWRCGWPGRAFFYLECSEDTPGARHIEAWGDRPAHWQVACHRRRNLWSHPDSVTTKEEREARAAEDPS